MGRSNKTEIRLGLVEDAHFIREAIRSLMERAGVMVVGEAADGIEAIKMAKEKKPNMILMDMILPRKNGIDAAKEILENDPSIKIIACSTEGQEELIMTAIEAGCCNYITKPFKSQDLVDAVKKTFESRQRRVG